MIRAMYDSHRLIGRFAQDDSRKNEMIRALIVMIRTSEIFFYNVFVELFVNYTIIQLLFILFLLFNYFL